MEDNKIKKKAYIAERLELAVGGENQSDSSNSSEYLKNWFPKGM